VIFSSIALLHFTDQSEIKLNCRKKVYSKCAPLTKLPTMRAISI
jgi:hypothetical protein